MHLKSILSLSPCPPASLSVLFLVSLMPFLLVYPSNFPLDLHGYAFFGKYLNSDTSAYYIDVSTDFYCTLMKYDRLSLFIRYRDDLDVAGWPESGVIFDPQRAHYYMVMGMDYFFSTVLVSGYFMHDCIHFLDHNADGTPIFNRFKLSLGAPDFHYSLQLSTNKKILWRTTFGWYPGWQYHNWAVNYGADYQYDLFFDLVASLLKKSNIAVSINTSLGFAKADSNFYQQHMAQIACSYLSGHGGAIGTSLAYNIYNNDPLKSPDRLWLLSIFFQF